LKAEEEAVPTWAQVCEAGSRLLVVVAVATMVAVVAVPAEPAYARGGFLGGVKSVMKGVRAAKPSSRLAIVVEARRQCLAARSSTSGTIVERISETTTSTSAGP
jgi:hypothetical protein